jgi:hypothetical protein
MPTKEERKRKVIRYRTKKVKGGYIHIAVVKKKGKRGGKTIAGKVHKYKKRK